MARVRAELKEGSSYSFRTGPTFVKGTPQVLTDDKQIELVRGCGFFTVTDLEAEEAAQQAELDAMKAKTKANAEAAPEPKAKSRGRKKKG
jgi:hypothetical protein